MNLIEGVQQEMHRCIELLKEYEEIGPAGRFGLAMIKQEIKKAEKTISEGDLIGMLRSYEELKSCN